jgi:glutaminyl-peptide cyclotransferase
VRRLALGLLVLAVAACGSTARPAGPRASSSPPAKADRFDEDRAWRLIELQLRYGQRPAGSPQLRRLAVQLRRRLPGGRFEPLRNEPRLRNVVGVVKGRGPAVVIGAHYDTLAKPRGFVGANNGAAGTAIVVELARTAARLDRPAGAPELRFVLFDGEEPDDVLPEETRDFYSTGLRGSRSYVRRHGDSTRAMVLLDYVANKGLQLPREASSTPALWSQVRSAAGAAGAGHVFPREDGQTIIDDHTPFLRAGIPAVDLIDWSYRGHARGDTIDKLSPSSVDAVGETLVELIHRIDRGALRSVTGSGG